MRGSGAGPLQGLSACSAVASLEVNVSTECSRRRLSGRGRLAPVGESAFTPTGVASLVWPSRGCMVSGCGGLGLWAGLAMAAACGTHSKHSTAILHVLTGKP